MATIFVKAIPKTKAYVEANSPPYIVRISKAGFLSTVYPERWFSDVAVEFRHLRLLSVLKPCARMPHPRR